MRRILPFFLFILLVSPTPALAYRHQILNDVLGVSTASALPQIDPTAEGPGLILPDSPFFFLDQWKQDVRLFLAFSPEAKAQVHTQIAGERLAELRFMLAKNNVQASTFDLQAISDNLRQAAANVSQAQFAGRDVTLLAKQVNDNIKAKQKTLDSLETESTGTLKLEAKQTQQSLFESKVEVEDSLPEDQLENEVKDDLARRISERVDDASESAKLLKSDLAELEKQASEAAKSSLDRRQEALKKAIEKKNEALKKTEEKLLEAEKTRQEKLFEAQQKAAEQAQEALQNAQNAAIGFQKAQQALEQMRNTPTTTQTSGGTSSVSGGGGSGSGSSGGSSGGGSSGGGETEGSGGGGH